MIIDPRKNTQWRILQLEGGTIVLTYTRITLGGTPNLSLDSIGSLNEFKEWSQKNPQELRKYDHLIINSNLLKTGNQLVDEIIPSVLDANYSPNKITLYNCGDYPRLSGINYFDGHVIHLIPEIAKRLITS